MTSKSFRAAPSPTTSSSRAWIADFCAAGAVFRESDAVICLASKERAHSREAFLRAARGTLKRLGSEPGVGRRREGNRPGREPPTAPRSVAAGFEGGVRADQAVTAESLGLGGSGKWHAMQENA